jgi:hypothetical protein
MAWTEGRVRFVQDKFKLVDKEAKLVPFILNKIQRKYVLEDKTRRDIVLKARQQGFSSLNLADHATDFIHKENSECVVLADISDNAQTLLSRVKGYVKSYEEVNNIRVPMKYNSKFEMANEAMNSRITIGTAENTEFGRSRTITKLLMTEAAFYKNFRKLLASALQAVSPVGEVVIETTANGFNEFKDFWDDSASGQTGFAAHFYGAEGFYPPEFLDMKRRELGRLYLQEYPSTALEAFLTSGDPYFSQEALSWLNLNARATQVL